jgi:hypothetical protein
MRVELFYFSSGSILDAKVGQTTLQINSHCSLSRIYSGKFVEIFCFLMGLLHSILPLKKARV